MTDWPSISPAIAIISIVLGYLSGSIPFGLLLTRWAGLGDVRKIGSGNIGATNVLRTGSKKIAAATLLLDALKGTAPVVFMGLVGGETSAIVTAFSSFAGHLFPVWLKFKGGKGVATYIGVLFGLAWPLGLIFLACWLVVAFLSRKSSVSALTAAALSPVAAWLMNRPLLVVPALVLAAVIWWTHRANIGRLLRGEEPKIDLGSKA